jgi:hypothetical protein
MTSIMQGCSGGGSSTPTTLGDSASLTTSDTGAVMAANPTTLKGIGQEVAEVLKTNIITLNQKEATTFTKETNYCDISGLVNSETSGTLTKMTTQNIYEECKTEKSLQNGNSSTIYTKMDSEGKYPKESSLNIENDYTFNDIELKKDLTVQSDIVYDDNRNIKSITLTINGVVNYKRGTYTLKENKQTIEY